MTAADLPAGWLKLQMDDVAALGRARRKIIAAASAARINGHKHPVTVEFNVDELMAIDYMTRMCTTAADAAKAPSSVNKQVNPEEK